MWLPRVCVAPSSRVAEPLKSAVHSGLHPHLNKNTGKMVVGYACVGTNDLPKAKKFYEELLAPLGGKNVADTGRGHYFQGDLGGGLLVTLPFDGKPCEPGNGNSGYQAAAHEQGTHLLIGIPSLISPQNSGWNPLP